VSASFHPDHLKVFANPEYALWDAGKRLPPNEWEPGKPCSYYLKCHCGEIFNSHRLEENLIHVPHITQERARRFA
jgi:hypothetical protein